MPGEKVRKFRSKFRKDEVYFYMRANLVPKSNYQTGWDEKKSDCKWGQSWEVGVTFLDLKGQPRATAKSQTSETVMSKPRYQHREGDDPGKAWKVLPSYMKNEGHCPISLVGR